MTQAWDACIAAESANRISPLPNCRVRTLGAWTARSRTTVLDWRSSSSGCSWKEPIRSTESSKVRAIRRHWNHAFRRGNLTQCFHDCVVSVLKLVAEHLNQGIDCFSSLEIAPESNSTATMNRCSDV